MKERYYIKVGNCYVAFLGLFHEPTMKADYRKADPFLTREEAIAEANRRIESDLQDFSNAEMLADIIVNNDYNTNIDEIVENIHKEYIKEVVV